GAGPTWSGVTPGPGSPRATSGFSGAWPGAPAGTMVRCDSWTGAVMRLWRPGRVRIVLLVALTCSVLWAAPTGAGTNPSPAERLVVRLAGDRVRPAAVAAAAAGHPCG